MTYLEITSFDKQTSVTELDRATKNNLFPSLNMMIIFMMNFQFGLNMKRSQQYN